MTAPSAVRPTSTDWNCVVCNRIEPPCGWAQPVIVVTLYGGPFSHSGLVCHDCKTWQDAERAPLVGGD